LKWGEKGRTVYGEPNTESVSIAESLRLSFIGEKGPSMNLESRGKK